MKNIGNLFVRLFVVSLLAFRYFSTIASLFGAGAAPFFTAPAPAPNKPFRFGGSGSGSGQNVSAPAAPAPHPWLDGQVLSTKRLFYQLKSATEWMPNSRSEFPVLTKTPGIDSNTQLQSPLQSAELGRCPPSVGLSPPPPPTNVGKKRVKFEI